MHSSYIVVYILLQLFIKHTTDSVTKNMWEIQKKS